ncbi:MAG TPA: hypothetical protein VFM88_08990 [Vicinamibacteria bacterium]|nr:hypothetical protein [Vicinamibacteria bacterium]
MSPGRRALVLVFCLTLPLVTPRIRAADEIQYYASLRSLVLDGDLDYENEYRHFYERDPQGLEGFRDTFLLRRDPVSGRPINFAPLGAAILWAPFFVATHAGVLLARALGASVLADGYSFPYLAAVSFASALYAFLGLLLIHDLLMREGGFADAGAALAVIATWLGTPVVYYMTIAPGFGHAPSLFAVSLLLWLALRARHRGSAAAYFLCGLAGGLAGLVREQDALFLAFPAGLVAWELIRGGAIRVALRRGAALAAGAFLALLPQLAAYRALTGALGPSTLVTRKMTWSSPHALEVLFDPAHGLFFWTPLAFVATAGLLTWASRRRDVVAALLVLLLLLQVWINGAVESWHMAGAFGARRFIAASPLFAFGVAAVLHALRLRAGTPAAAALVAASLWWNLSLVVQFGLKLMDRQRLEWPRVAVNQVTEVPRHVLRSGWRFFSDRERLAREGP